MLSIRTILIVGIVGLQVVTVGAITLSSYLTTDKVLVTRARSLMSRVATETAQHAERYLSLARETVDLTQHLANYRVLRRQDQKGMEIYFLEQLSLHPSFAGIYFGATDGSFTYVKRESGSDRTAYLTKIIRILGQDRTVELVRRDSDYGELSRETDPKDRFDPRTRPWFRNALIRDGPVWTEPYIFFTSRKPGITSASPVYDADGSIIGAVGVDIEIDELSQFLGSLPITEHARAFMVNGNGDVIAYPNLDLIHKAVQGHNGELRFVRIDEFDDRLARRAYESLGRPAGNFAIQEKTFTSFDAGGRTYLASFIPILHPDLPWSLGIYLPKDDFLGVFKDNQRFNLYVAIGITAGACLLGVILWHGISRPLTALQRHARVVADGDFKPPPEIKSAYREIRELVQSFDRMVLALGERDRRNAALSEALREREVELRQAQKMEVMGQLTGGIAHDFNNLLAVVIGNLDFLHDALADDPKRQEIVDRAIQATLRGADTTQRLLAFARRQRLTPEVVDLNALVANMTDLMRRTLGETITVELDAATDLKPVKVDPPQIEAALLNLAMNARYAMPSGGALRMETRNIMLDRGNPGIRENAVPGPYVMVSVRDSGIGMSPDVLEHVFEPFFTTKAVGEGSGLGLSMVHGFVKQSLGNIAIKSEPGAGTDVRLYFPAAGDALSDPVAGDPPFEDVAGNGETILVVEDDAEVRAVALAAISALGYKVLQAADGPDALAVLDRESKVDVLFTDMVLPNGMSGVELGAEALRRYPGIKVLYTSGYSEVISGTPDMPEQTVDIIPKPYRRDELARHLHAALHQTAG